MTNGRRKTGSTNFSRPRRATDADVLQGSILFG